MAGTYITLDDCKAQDALLAGIVKQVNVDRANEEVENLARRRSVPVTEIKTSPLHPYLKEFAIFFCLERVAGGAAGSNPRVIQQTAGAEPYNEKRQQYRQLRLECETLLTPEVITGNIVTGSDFANPTIPIYRG